MNTNSIDLLVNKLVSLSEADLTHQYVIPLLKSLGYVRVDYYGGPYEKGKDLICEKLDELLQPLIAVAQIKKYKLTAKSSGDKTFSEIVSQLQQAKENKIATIEGFSYYPSIVYFITPYQIDKRTLESRFEGYSALRHVGVKIMDGQTIVSLLQEKAPHLIKLLTGGNFSIQQLSRDIPTNRDLFKALKYRSDIDVSEYYCELIFGLGSITTKFFFSLSLNPSIYRVSCNKTEWDLIKTAYSIAKKVFNIKIFDKEIDTVEYKYKTSSDTLKHQLNLLDKKIAKLIELFSSGTKHNKSDHNKLIEEKRIKIRAIADLGYDLEINGKEIAEKITEAQEWLSNTIKEDLNSYSNHELSSFIEKCRLLFNATNSLLSIPFIAYAIGASSSQEFKKNLPKLNIKIDRIFNTRENILVLGDAGSGKTTSLYIYSKNKINSSNDYYIFLPLTSIIQSKTKLSKLKAPVDLLNNSIINYFKKHNIDIQDLGNLIEDHNTTLLLDGIDEVIMNAPWIIDGIVGISQKFPKIQLIVSSRASNEHVKKIPFLVISLLPFNEEQIYQFIKNWFVNKDKSKATIVIEHLKKHRDLIDIVSSPLLTTLLCVLSEHKIQLPNTEARLYEERMRLLSGIYDISKNISRVSTSDISLNHLCRKLAFDLHRKNKRFEKKLSIIDILSASLKATLSREQVILAINELIDPCNILIPMTDDGLYGFGHLRYQEYLVANELMANRGINIKQYLSSPWWRGALTLFAQITDNIDFVFNEFALSAKNNESVLTVEAMINARPEKERKFLVNIYKKHKSIDDIDLLSEFDSIF